MRIVLRDGGGGGGWVRIPLGFHLWQGHTEINPSTTVSVPLQLFQSHNCFIDVFGINSPFIETHNKCIINLTLNVMVC